MLWNTKVFQERGNTFPSRLPAIQTTASAVAAADAFCSLATVAVQRGYCRPEITLGSEIHIVDGRHPVVEQMLTDSLVCPK